MRKVFPIQILLGLLGVFAQSVGSPALESTRPSPVTTHALAHVQQVKALTDAEAARGLPVLLEATVTYVRPQENTLFVMEDGYGIYLRFSKEMGLLPGDRVAVRGVTEASFRPIVAAQEVRFLGHGAMPAAKLAKFEDLIQARLDCQYVQLEGRVLAASLDEQSPKQGLRLQMRVPNGVVEGIVANPGNLQPRDLLDSEVRVNGVAAGAFDSKMQMAGVWLDVNSAADVTIERPPAVDPWSLPLSPMQEVIFGYRDAKASERMRVAGTLTYFEPGTLAVLERDGRAMLLETRSSLPLHSGMGVQAIGFPMVVEQSVRLQEAQLRPVAQAETVTPQRIGWADASMGRYAYHLVSMEGDVVEVVHDARMEMFLMRSDGHLFSATLRHRSSDASGSERSPNSGLDSGQDSGLESAGGEISVGSRVRITGVCFVDPGNHWRDRLWFDLRMRSMQDIAVVRQPSFWTAKRVPYLITLLALAILAAGIWVWMLGQRLRSQTAVIARRSQEDSARERKLARQEQQRSSILEMISSSEPLAGVLREITSMVSSRLDGASCWFELIGNAGVTGVLDRPTGPAIVYQELFSPEGNSLGYLLATPLLQTTGETDVSGSLLVGARLGELAIDTRRLYSDLRHRSEHDLLTDIPNRFSMEKQLDQLMLGAEHKGDIFGLIYVDLDRFKQVNDRYGHRTGDLYLQEVTRRMKFQLRNGDTLARIGGDEFIALVPILRSRADAEEITMRLERCFDDPFMIDGYRLDGSASVGLAVYPEDGTTQEELQRFADSAMYASKEGKRHQEKLSEAMQRIVTENYQL